ncbi:MAG: hypothetical protein C0392_14815 [Syntrophus sp. (in: bacteria)]|nr:hypothetical protein [Syntrophus sp. (in: bacteria)]
MSKDITICFRTSDSLRSALEKISQEERRSLSSTIETILYKHLENKRELKRIEKEKRRYERKKVSAPALISSFSSDDKAFKSGIVLDISLGGLQISIPDNYQYEIKEDSINSRISIVFPLPEDKKPLTMQCIPRHVYHSNNDTTIGASFIDPDFSSYQSLQNYLIN